MTANIPSCDLCGLPVRHGSYSLATPGETLHFCCNGCRLVFRMILESTDKTDPGRFKETSLYKKCLEMGIIPGSEADLARQAKETDDRPKIAQEGRSDNILDLALAIGGMWCPACAMLIDEVLKKDPGVVNSSCNFSTDRLRCEYDPVLTSPSQITDAINRLGYRAYLPEESGQQKEDRREFIRFGISAFLTLNVMMLSFALYSGFVSNLQNDAVSKISWPIFIMSACVLIYGGAKIFQKAVFGLTQAAYSMETLISIGALVTFLFSCYNFFTKSIHQYFDTAAMLITLVLLGKLLERRAKDTVLKDLERFLLLMPKKVRICTPEFPDGRYVSVGHLMKDDVFKVEPQDIVPADGLIVDGDGTVNESSLTGEALPVTKRPGYRLRSGSKIISGVFRVKAEHVGADSMLGRMIRIVEEALSQKTAVEGKTDLILRWFVPSVVFLSILTGLGCGFFGLSAEDAVIRAVTVLVISCPCALGIAIPLARVAGVSLAGKHGILVRNFSAFPQSEKVDAFVFDKTGTLTKGNWSLLRIVPLGRFTEDQILSMAFALEKDSDHYLGAEIRRHAKIKGLALPEIKDIQYFENGISGLMKGKEIKIGSKGFLSLENDALVPEFDREESDLQTAMSTVHMTFDKTPCATFMFGDMIRGSAFSVLGRLRSSGYSLTLVSGDGERITRELGKKLGFEAVYGERLPQDKALVIETLKREGHCVAMVGDGINDAPALAVSDLAFAIYSGYNLGKDAADITLMQGDPGRILDFLRFSKRVNRKILQNLLFSLIYNAVGIPVAMAGLLTPLMAVCAMLMSSLTVIGNTFLLVRNGIGRDI